MATFSVNTGSTLLFNTHYTTLQPPSTTLADRVAVRTYNGLRRCSKCFCLRNSPDVHQKTCQGIVPWRTRGIPCPKGCGLILSTTKAAAIHSPRCEGLAFTVDKYNTCVCPKCHIAGFAPRFITQHISQCEGDVRSTMFSYCRGQQTIKCDKCNDIFLREALIRHTCHIKGDPVWLGQQSGPPDLTITYVRWCRANGLTLGGVPGKMPDCIPDETLWVPAVAASPEMMQCGAGSVQEDAGDFLEDGWNDETRDGQWHKDAAPGDIQSEVWESIAIPASDKLRAAQISFDRFVDTPCEGLTWRHGCFPCPFRAQINVETIYASSGKPGTVELSPFCIGCAKLQSQIRKWMSESKYTIDGVRLCRRPACREPVAAVWNCRYHADQLTRINHSGERRRGQAKTISSRDLAYFLEHQSPRFLISPKWLAVKRAIEGSGTTPVFFVDTESVYDRQQRRFMVCEIAIFSATRTLLLNTTVDHGLSFRQLTERVDQNLWAKLHQIYNFHNTDSKTSGLTAQAIAAQLLTIGFSPESIMVEWSLTGFDLPAMRNTFDGVQLPLTPLLGPRLWRGLGLPGSLALQPLFESLDPASPLNKTHHVAVVDAEKLFLTVKAGLDCMQFPEAGQLP